MKQYVPPSERRNFHYGVKISVTGLSVCIIMLFAFISAISAVQASFIENPTSQVTDEKTEDNSTLIEGNVVAKKASSKQLTQVALLNAPAILQNLPVERVWPVRGRITTYYSRYHQGVDLANPWGTPVHPFASGVVVFAGWQGGFGNCIIINHNNGFSTTYAHLGRIGVIVGQQVNTGTEIGVVGSTGNSTGPHLHFQLSQNGRTINPISALP